MVKKHGLLGELTYVLTMQWESGEALVAPVTKYVKLQSS